MGYEGPPGDADVFPWKDKDAQYEYGVKTANRIWKTALEKATIGPKSQNYQGNSIRLKPKGNQLLNALHHILYCDYWDDYRSQAYLNGITEQLEQLIRDHLKEN